jgi:hypothetical protein
MAMLSRAKHWQLFISYSSLWLGGIPLFGHGAINPLFKSNVYYAVPLRDCCNNVISHIQEKENMKLIYRAQIIEFTTPAVQPYQKPRALNWRYQVAGETYNNTPLDRQPYRQPRALNWRFRLAQGGS